MPQEAFLFTGTIRDNIAYGRPDASDAEVEAAARAVGAHEFIAALPGGYLHELTERGRSLSAGQRQLHRPGPGRAGGPGHAAARRGHLQPGPRHRGPGRRGHATRSPPGRTTIIIAHRLQTARAADRIVVLDSGRIAEIGAHDELLAAGGRYAAMWEAFETATTGAR